VFLHPGEQLKDVSIKTPQCFPKDARLEYDLSEVPVVNENRKPLLD
jgi:hypothetical protein